MDEQITYEQAKTLVTLENSCYWCGNLSDKIYTINFEEDGEPKKHICCSDCINDDDVQEFIFSNNIPKENITEKITDDLVNELMQ